MMRMMMVLLGTATSGACAMAGVGIALWAHTDVWGQAGLIYGLVGAAAGAVVALLQNAFLGRPVREAPTLSNEVVTAMVRTALATARLQNQSGGKRILRPTVAPAANKAKGQGKANARHANEAASVAAA